MDAALSWMMDNPPDNDMDVKETRSRCSSNDEDCLLAAIAMSLEAVEAEKKEAVEPTVI